MKNVPDYVKVQIYLEGKACLVRFPQIREQRGTLLPFYFDSLPFVPMHSFCVSHVPAGAVRGKHAHRTASQLLCCLSGEIEVTLRSGRHEVRIQLIDDAHGLLVGPGVWAQQRYHTEKAILLVMGSEAYSPASYIEETEQLS